jgi:hypothetical protein
VEEPSRRLLSERVFLRPGPARTTNEDKTVDDDAARARPAEAASEKRPSTIEKKQLSNFFSMYVQS